ncbi:hypothetical protein [Ktedonobacter racemifer]|uniref:hypothetical protein n=1 Tax=Ktedonobacter racemifer TaxID=363277 RepID=UPI00058E0D03|nr:hypothetical protein [Ktedonobacter racemifer]
MVLQIARERKSTTSIPAPAPVEREARQVILSTYTPQQIATHGMKFCCNHWWHGDTCLYGNHSLAK